MMSKDRIEALIMDSRPAVRLTFCIKEDRDFVIINNPFYSIPWEIIS
jgi:hypothetical protein